MALSDDDLRCMIVLRLEAAYGSCNHSHLDRVEGQIQGLMAALTGEPCHTSNACEVLKMAGIPFAFKDRGFEYDDDWLARMGFEFDTEDINGHKRLKGNW